MEALMASGQYEYQSDFARRYVAQGRAEGRAEGLARAVLTVLAARRIEVPAEARARIAACTDLALLEQWLGRAADARQLVDVLPDTGPSDDVP
ncbi:MAG TPA: hypothetical protein VKP14_09420 [Gaiellaceae bacterium]|nr:hypothetical protein [Gaiellaceae bacterium]